MAALRRFSERTIPRISGTSHTGIHYASSVAMNIQRASLLLSLLAAACADHSFEQGIDDPDMTESEIGTKPAPGDVSWRELSLPRAGLDGNVTIDDIAFARRPDGTPLTKDNGKPIVFVIERIGMKRLSGFENGQLGALVDPGVALLLRSDDGGDTFQLATQLPGLGVRAHLRLAPIPRGESRARIYIEAPSDDTGLRGGPLSFHGALLRSDDGGYSFTSLPGGVADVEVDTQNPDVLTGIDCRGLVRSTDGGASWNAITVNPIASCEGLPRLVRTKDPNRYYAVFGMGELRYPFLYRSDDGGKSFFDLTNPERAIPPANLAADPLDANHVWAWGYQGFLSSADGARTFAPHNRGLVPDGNPEVQYSIGNVVIDDLHRPPGQEKHTLWLTNEDRVLRWSPENGPEGGQWKQIGTVPGKAVRMEIAGRGTMPKPFAVVRRDDQSEALLRGTFAYAP